MNPSASFFFIALSISFFAASSSAWLKRTKRTEDETQRMTSPTIRSAFGQGISGERNNIPALTAPIFPPAATTPVTNPSAFLLIKGTTEYVAPSAIWTNKLKRTIPAIAKGRTVICEKRQRKSPSPTTATKSHRTLPFSPYRRPILSPIRPPSPRAKIFINPKVPATSPAVFRPKSK